MGRLSELTCVGEAWDDAACRGYSTEQLCCARRFSASEMAGAAGETIVPWHHVELPKSSRQHLAEEAAGAKVGESFKAARGVQQHQHADGVAAGKRSLRARLAMMPKC